VKKVKPNFAKLGKQYGPKMKEVAAVIHAFTTDDIKAIEKVGVLTKGEFNLNVEDVLISSEDIPGATRSPNVLRRPVVSSARGSTDQALV
jgi:isoleucyl-tRNA synthetase